MVKPVQGSLRDDEQGVLVLQGGGALGAYQAGVFEELNEHGITISWLAGVSIGAVNAAIIAGNPPALRTERLRSFWNTVSSAVPGWPMMDGKAFHEVFNGASAFLSSAVGVPGFFKPRFIPPMLSPKGEPAALSYYDSSPLRETLETLIDFDRLNSGEIRLSLGAVNIKTGNSCNFDTQHTWIGPEHIMASGALPPGLPPITIDDEAFWDGGLVSNTPLQAVLDDEMKSNLCVFQVDVFSAAGDLPLTIFDVYEREKEIRYSSRTRLNTKIYKEDQEAHRLIGKLLDKLPPEFANTEEAKRLRGVVPRYGTAIVHLIYRKQPYEASNYDYEFSRRSVEEHWQAGRAAVIETLRHPHWKARRTRPGVVDVLDLTKPIDQAKSKSATPTTAEEHAETISQLTRSMS